jgi:hypothetical protein
MVRHLRNSPKEGTQGKYSFAHSLVDGSRGFPGQGHLGMNSVVCRKEKSEPTAVPPEFMIMCYQHAGRHFLPLSMKAMKASSNSTFVAINY